MLQTWSGRVGLCNVGVVSDTVVHARLPAEVAARLDELATLEDRTRSAMVRVLVTRALNEAQPGPEDWRER